MDEINSLKQIFALVDEAKERDAQLRVVTKTLKEFADYHKACLNKWADIYSQLTTQNRDFEEKLKNAQKLLYTEKQKLSSAVKERNTLVAQMNCVKDILRDDRVKFQNETKEKLSFLNNPCDTIGHDKLETILELDSTDYLMSELSYTLDDEDVSDTSSRRSRRNKRAPIRYPLDDDQLDVSKAKKSRGKQTTSYTADQEERVIATTTVTVPHNGPVSATSVIETIPKPLPYERIKYLPSAPPMSMYTDCESESLSDEARARTPKRPFACQTNIRLHSWNQKSHIMGETCSVCAKKMKFSTVAAKCSNCKAIAHTNCKERVPLPCVPVCLNTPNTKSSKFGNIADYVPQTVPMVPPLVVHCIREVEARGFNEVGLYRVPGSDREVKTLKDKLIKARGVIDLSGVSDIHVICGCLKEFLRSLKEPLIPQNKWTEFSRASDVHDGEQRKNTLYHIIQNLNQPNRETLAYIVLHLQRVATAPNVKMPVSNLSKMFGPTIVGYSKYEPENLLAETGISNKVMAEMILLPTECWEELLYPNSDENQNPELLKTPSSSSLHGFFNSTSSVKTVRKYRFFDTP